MTRTTIPSFSSLPSLVPSPLSLSYHPAWNRPRWSSSLSFLHKKTRLWAERNTSPLSTSQIFPFPVESPPSPSSYLVRILPIPPYIFSFLHSIAFSQPAPRSRNTNTTPPTDNLAGFNAPVRTSPAAILQSLPSFEKLYTALPSLLVIAATARNRPYRPGGTPTIFLVTTEAPRLTRNPNSVPSSTKSDPDPSVPPFPCAEVTHTLRGCLKPPHRQRPPPPLSY